MIPPLTPSQLGFPYIVCPAADDKGNLLIEDTKLLDDRPRNLHLSPVLQFTHMRMTQEEMDTIGIKSQNEIIRNVKRVLFITYTS